MKHVDEKTLLRHALAELDGKAKHPSRFAHVLTTLSLWLLTFSVAMLYFRYGQPAHWTDALLATVCLGVGVWLTHDLYRSTSRRHWSQLAPYIDRAKLEQRLRRLDMPETAGPDPTRPSPDDKTP
ncbi:hypothetical protein K4L06_04595 [Lysobacter sp. BMK333-48F3]|uniref:hypothetical protein n=1 Tax=Lysobacter sp. BMK333-48F3 TaxID=2867962 RepID=UPI001C8C5178|nr:hypothetical protein [Lysobacter sp. BMK333-48F3]MBX9400581.1 hypothetical protein [Lysobacter sp. BMK333-48F3]